MKRYLSLLLVVIMCFSLTACIGEGGTNETYYKLGDTVSTDIFEFTLDAAQFTIALSNVNDDDRFTPKEYDPKYDADNPYVAPVGHTYAAFTYTVKNLNRASSEFHKGSFATVKYDGKKYTSLEEGAYFRYEDQMIMDANGNLRTEKGGEWYNDPGSNFLLMTGEKQTRRAYIDISVSIEDLEEDVLITFAIPKSNGSTEKFTYLVTAADRAGK